MLHLHQDANASAVWGHRGWVPMLAPTERHHHLWWVLEELKNAADNNDEPAVEDLLMEAGVLLGLVIAGPDPLLSPADASSVRGIVLEEWGTLQQSFGRSEWDMVALTAVTLRKLVPAPTVTSRPPAAPPPYRAGPAGAALPLVTDRSPRPLLADAPGAAFLQLLPAALSAGFGRLVDPNTGQAPRAAVGRRVGSQPDPRPADIPVVGSLGGDSSELLTLLPEAAVTAVNHHLGRQTFTVTDVAGDLAGKRQLDVTLVIEEGQIRRFNAVWGSHLAGGDEGWVWQLPLSLWHLRQFLDPGSGTPAASSGRSGLRLIRGKQPD